MRALLVLCVIGCGGVAHPHEAVHDTSSALIAATVKGDAAAVQKLLRAPLGYGGVWFRNADCNQRFASAGTIQEADLPGFALCLAMLPLRSSPHRRYEAPDAALLVYDPGFEIEARFVDGRVTWLGYVARQTVGDAQPTLHPETLAALRVTGDPELVALRPTFDAERTSHNLSGLDSWFKVCIDVEGRVTNVEPRQVGTPVSASAIAGAIKTWTFRPFAVDGQPTPACAFIAFHYPQTGDPDDVLPLPPPPGVATTVVLGPNVLKRTSGERLVTPDDADKSRIAGAGDPQIHALLLYCIDEAGHVTTGYLARSSGLSHYDARLVRAVKQWQFEPFVSEGKPIPVCSTVAFIYSQR